MERVAVTVAPQRSTRRPLRRAGVPVAAPREQQAKVRRALERPAVQRCGGASCDCPPEPTSPDVRADGPGLVAAVPGRVERGSEAGQRETIAGKTGAAPAGRLGVDERARLGRALATFGRPLEQGVRARLEAGFGRDLSGVRLHEAAPAVEMLKARAVTVGQDIHIRPDAYHPETRDGMALLAHEVAHTIQQGPVTDVPTRVSSPDEPLERSAQRAGDAVARGERLAPQAFPAERAPTIGRQGSQLAVGPPDDRFEREADSVADSVVSGGPEVVEQDDDEAGGTEAGDDVETDEQDEAVAQVAQRSAATPEGDATRSDPPASPVHGSPATPALQRQPEGDEPQAAGDEPTAADRSVTVYFFDGEGNQVAAMPFVRSRASALPVGVYPATITATTITIAGQPPEAYTFGKPDTAAALLRETKSVVIAVSDPSQKTEGGEEEPGSGPAPGKTVEAGEGAGKGEAGSEFGGLGLISLPKPVRKALEGVLKVLGNTEEMKAIRDLLVALKELADNRAELAELFTSDKLLNVVLGLESSPGVDALERWAIAARRKRPLGRSGKRKGLAAVAAKLQKVVEVLRRVLRPVFRARSAFTGALGLLAVALEKVPLIEDVLGATDEEQRRPEFQRLIDSIAEELAGTAQETLAGARKSVQLVTGGLSEQDFVTYEELAQAVTQAALNAVPKTHRPFVWAARKIGLVDSIADTLIAPLLPKDALDAVNGLIRTTLERLEPLIEEVTDAIDEVLAGIEEEVRTTLGPELKVLLARRAPLDGSAGAEPWPADDVGARLASSSGWPLEPGPREELEQVLGRSLGDVRVHTDGAAVSVSEDLRAKAVTVGRDVYFGPGRFAPGTPEGMRLLAHEVTHVAQQAEGADPAQIRRDPKDAKQKLGKAATAKLLAAATGLVKPSAKTLKRGAQIAAVVKRLIGRKVVSRTNPRLPADAYVYVQNRKSGALVGIRRRLQFVRVPGVPKLRITRAGRIAEALAEKLDPVKRWKKNERAKLRRALGCSKNEEAHHLIPLELFGIAGIGGHPVADAAHKAGFVISGSENGLCLRGKVHGGSHPGYTQRVRKSLDAFMGLSAAEQLAGCRKVAAGRRSGLRARTERLD